MASVWAAHVRAMRATPARSVKQVRNLFHGVWAYNVGFDDRRTKTAIGHIRFYFFFATFMPHSILTLHSEIHYLLTFCSSLALLDHVRNVRCERRMRRRGSVRERRLHLSR